MNRNKFLPADLRLRHESKGREKGMVISVKNKFFTREICAYAQTRRLSKNGGLI